MIECLETERLILRRWKSEDRQPFAELNADSEVMEFFPNRLSRAESDAMVDRIEASFETKGLGLWAVERIGDGVSFTATSNHRSRRVMERLGMALSEEFDHPNVAEGDSLRRHVLYRMSAKEWRV